MSEKEKYIIISPAINDPDLLHEVMKLEDMDTFDWLMLEPGEKYTFKVVERTNRWFNNLQEI